VPNLSPHVLDCMRAPQPTLRQAAVFGAGILARNGGPAVSPLLPALVRGLEEQLALPKDSAMAACRDNVVAALVRVVQSRAGEIPPADIRRIVTSVLRSFPLRVDSIEAR